MGFVKNQRRRKHGWFLDVEALVIMKDFGKSGLADDKNDVWDKEKDDHTEIDSLKWQNEFYCCGCQGYTSVIVLIRAP